MQESFHAPIATGIGRESADKPRLPAKVPGVRRTHALADFHCIVCTTVIGRQLRVHASMDRCGPVLPLPVCTAPYIGDSTEANDLADTLSKPFGVGRGQGVNGRQSALSEHPKGMLIHAEAFPGWENFAGLAAHIRFVRNHHQKIERVALVTDSPVARVAEAVAEHFIAAEIEHFPFADYEKALIR